MGRKARSLLLGYTVVNVSQRDFPRPVVADEESLVYPTYTEVREERDILRREHGNPYLVVVGVYELKGEPNARMPTVREEY